MLFKSGYTDYDNAVRPVLAPGPLAEACGFTYQEYSSINKLPLKPSSPLFQEGSGEASVNTWMEFLQLTTAQPLATVDHQFFGQWPCITENQYGKGHLIYIGTVPSTDLLYKLIARAADRKGIAIVERQYQFPVILRSGTNAKGRQIHYLFMSCGSEELPRFQTDKTADALRQAGIRVDLQISEGTDHEWLTWRRGLSQFVPHLFRK
jgi:beta-galactosidase